VKELVQKIRAKIQCRGTIPFHDFMQMALYCPVYGYYEKESDIIGASGDYFTSPSVGPLFGQLLAFQFSEWLECPEIAQSAPLGVHPSVLNLNPNPAPDRAGSPCRSQKERAGERRPPLYQIVEAGAHDGALASDILTWIRQHRPGLFDRLEYWIIEPSAFRRSRQQETLVNFGGKVQWAEGFTPPASAATQHAPVLHSAFDEGGTRNTQQHPIRNTQYAIRSSLFSGLIFSNELLDAFPVHRLGWDAKDHSWFEWGVEWKADQFVWSHMPQLSPEAASFEPDLPGELLDILPDDFTTEVSPAASEWWRKAANSLNHGKLLAIDYGLEAAEFFLPERAQGTLRSYHRHRPMAELLANPGEQDLTANVNFSALKEVGESCGLITEPLQTQAQLLTDIFSRLADSTSPSWTQQQTRQFQTLTHPDHLGRAFRVFIHKRI